MTKVIEISGVECDVNMYGNSGKVVITRKNWARRAIVPIDTKDGDNLDEAAFAAVTVYVADIAKTLGIKV